MTPEPADTSSYANINDFVAYHLVLDLTADFATKTLSGTAELLFHRAGTAPAEVILDTRDLTILKTEAAAAGPGDFTETPFTLDPATDAFGAALRIAMPPGTTRVRVTYQTSPDARGLQWLDASQTSGRTHPFLFSQAQAIHARSFIPLQDLPAVRLTYEATIHTPGTLVAVMAADMDGPGHFTMPQAIPSYLIALAIGDLTFVPMSARTGVWAEPSVVAAAAREFDDTERMIELTEALYGPYRWGRYDLLVLPPSFPFGGMENPKVTFATPTILVGDKSLVSLVAHELAHSWSGNLVTNATWSDFWLNEGFTTYLERRIVEAAYGQRRADMEWLIGLRELEDSRVTLPAGRDRSLLPDMTGRDPDDAYSTVPYEQGALFLAFLESRVGRKAFDTFLKQWFDSHAFMSATTSDFLTFLEAHLPAAATPAEVQEWLRSEILPASAVIPTSDAFVAVERALNAFLDTGDTAALATEATTWSTHEWLHFIDTLPRSLATPLMSALDSQFQLTSSPNAEIAHAWFRLAIATNYAFAVPSLEDYMVRIGRRKLVVPLYSALAATPAGKAAAARIYERARAGYHALTRSAVEDILR
jgi:leukotriene-A4 hydrolase